MHAHLKTRASRRSPGRNDPWSLAVITAALGVAIVTGGTCRNDVAALAAAIVIGWVLHRALGGWTGDGIGAAQQIAETAFLLGAAASWT